MSITITATAGATDANSFAAETDLIGFYATRLNVPAGATVTGTACTEDEKKALIEATRDLLLLEQRYIGQRVTTTQALSWPRQFAINPDAPEIIAITDIALLYFATTVVPQRMINATCELAMEYLKAGTTDIAALDSTIGLASERVGPLGTTYVEPEKRAQGLSRFPRVMQWVSPLLMGASSVGLAVERL